MLVKGVSCGQHVDTNKLISYRCSCACRRWGSGRRRWRQTPTTWQQTRPSRTMAELADRTWLRQKLSLMGRVTWSEGVFPLIARFMEPTWGPSGADRIQVGPMLAPWTLFSGSFNQIQLPVFYLWPNFYAMSSLDIVKGWKESPSGAPFTNTVYLESQHG